MFQLTYKLDDIDPFIHQISQFGAHFVSKGPETETYYKSPNHQLRIEEGVTVELVMIHTHDHYQELFEVNIPQYPQMKQLLQETLEERTHLTKQVIRYHLQKVLLEIHRYDKLPQLLFVQAENLNACKNLARQLSLQDADRISQTPADLSEQ